MDNFVNKWIGNRIDFDGVYRYQCVDLVLQYLAEVHGLRGGIWGNAIDYWTKTSSPILKKFDKVQSQSPQKGDIVVLNGLTGNPYGHVMLAVNSDTGLEQNGSTGNGSGTGNDSIRLRAIPKNRIAGILRPKPASVPRKTNDQLATEVLQGLWGNGEDRKKRLTQTGYDYNGVQAIVNQRINNRPAPQNPLVPTYTVKAGDNLSSIAPKYGTTWQQLYEWNKAVIGSNPNLIKAGQVLRVR